eukprot:TRINITY_DN193_c0_g2_i1.p1 TRINITY_DN193_c0_g2~~TRINITY_DN193_c0_g2_i1.p1  ORF type:complete len:1013 (-),score=242.34 TRINITY_DN193_c0_g2_i1:77-3115(-)
MSHKNNNEEYNEEELFGSNEDEGEAGPNQLSDTENAGEFEDAPEYEDDEEEDYEIDHRGKKRPRTSNPFIDDIADVDEEDDEVEDGEDLQDLIDDGPVEESEGRASVHRPRRPAYNNFDDDEDDYESVEAQAREIDRKHRDYSHRGDSSSYSHYYEDRTDINQQGYLPSVKDPKLWLVKCKVGKEREACVMLLQRCFEVMSTEKKLQIKSAVSCDNLKGFIYIEAEKELHVKNATDTLRHLFEYGPVKLVPLKEMVDVFKKSKKEVDIAKNTWVRVTSGTYKGDLAQVIGMNKFQTKAEIRLIPRIEFTKKEKEEEASNSAGDPKSKKRPLNRRPSQKFFSVEEARLSGEAVQDQTNGFYQWSNQRFKGGFLYKSVSTKSLATDDVVPSLDEIERFKIDKKSEDQFAEAPQVEMIETIKPKGAPAFSKGDCVEAIGGDLKGIMGIVETIDDSMVVVIPKPGYDFQDPFSYPPTQLQKYFKIGDHCKIFGGRYDGETGLITQIHDNVVYIFSDLTRQEVKALKSDISLCAEVTSCNLTLGNYELHDMVMLNSSCIGVIVKIERDTFHVLDILGVIHHVRLLELGNKINSKFCSALDKFNNKLNVEDLVNILDGTAKGKQGQIKHMYRQAAFILCKDLKENSGMVVLASKFLALSGGKTDNSSQRSNTSRSPSSSSTNGGGGWADDSFGRGRGRGRGRGDDRPGGRGRGGRGPNLRNKLVTVTRGQFKGHFGIVTEITERTVRVELNSKSKTINLDTCDIVLREDQSSFRGSSSYGRGGGGGRGGDTWGTPATPLRSDYGRSAPTTPHRDSWDSGSSGGSSDNFGSNWRNAPTTPHPQTPVHNASWGGFMTPSRSSSDSWDGDSAGFGSSTPRRPSDSGGGWGSATPRRNDDGWGSATPRRNDDGWGSATPRRNDDGWAGSVHNTPRRNDDWNSSGSVPTPRRNDDWNSSSSSSSSRTTRRDLPPSRRDDQWNSSSSSSGPTDDWDNDSWNRSTPNPNRFGSGSGRPVASPYQR